MISRFVSRQQNGHDKVRGVTGGGQRAAPLASFVERTLVHILAVQVRLLDGNEPHLEDVIAIEGGGGVRWYEKGIKIYIINEMNYSRYYLRPLPHYHYLIYSCLSLLQDLKKITVSFIILILITISGIIMTRSL